MKLDFKKAFDRVDHDYIWATLIAMYMDPFVITLIMGLVTSAEAKVHVNGLFIRSFPLKRGATRETLHPLDFCHFISATYESAGRKMGVG